MNTTKTDPGLDGVPPERVAAVIGGYVRDGAVHITLIRNADGTWRIVPEFK